MNADFQTLFQSSHGWLVQAKLDGSTARVSSAFICVYLRLIWFLTAFPPPNPGGRKITLSCGRLLAHADKLVHVAVHGQSSVDVSARVNAHAVNVAALQTGDHLAVRVAHADVRRLVAVFLLGNVVVAVLAARNVVRSAHPGPHADEIAVRRENLHALVAAIGDVEPTLRVDR